MEAAYVFGTLGNLVSALGQGWSIEDEFAWAIGHESVLTLPLPGNERALTLRLDVHPALFPGAVERQRLTVMAADTVIADFEVSGRTTLAVPLPTGLTVGRNEIRLRLVHPDAARPSDYQAVNDRRPLALCFHSGVLGEDGSDIRAPIRAGLEPVHGLIAGDGVARWISEAIAKLPCMAKKIGVRYLPFGKPLDAALAEMPQGTLETADFCWIEMSAGTPAIRDPLQGRIPESCERLSFYTPTVRALWPFQGPDPRAVPEPGRYDRARYPYGDRLALPLAAMNMPDDVVFLMYEMSAEAEPVDLEDLFMSDLRRWRANESAADMHLAQFIEQKIHSTQLFIAPSLPAPALLREMTEQVLSRPMISDVVARSIWSAELDVLLDGYVGWQEEVPVHKRVANHFGLSWWSPDLKYRWMNNYRTYREYTLDYIRWVQWRT